MPQSFHFHGSKSTSEVLAKSQLIESLVYLMSDIISKTIRVILRKNLYNNMYT